MYRRTVELRTVAERRPGVVLTITTPRANGGLPRLEGAMTSPRGRSGWAPTPSAHAQAQRDAR